MKFPLRIFSVNVTNVIKVPADLVTLTKEILNGKLHFLCSVFYKMRSKCDQNIMVDKRDRKNFLTHIFSHILFSGL